MRLLLLGKLMIVTAMSLFVLACSSDGGSPITSSTPCESARKCKSALYAPVCADTGSAYCADYLSNEDGSSGVCLFRLAASQSCGCVEKTIQYCPGIGNGGARQIQDCVASGGMSASWGGCHD